MKFPTWVRVAAVVWLAVWIPAYWKIFGWQNFVHYCDIALILTCAGIFLDDALLISSQAVATLLPDALWIVDAASGLLFRRHVFGGTEYLWDPQYPAWVRMLSLYHVVMPVVILLAVRQTGYDRRGWRLQSGIAAAALLAARWTVPALNINYAFTDPLFHRAWGPPPVHLLAMFAGIVVVIYLPTHFVLQKYFPEPGITAAKVKN
ncbi:MAG: hypothetical protein ACRD50_15825 [Candidatus Acidiferrales bacterium]